MGRATGQVYNDGPFIGSVDNGDLLVSGGLPNFDNHYSSFWAPLIVGDAFLLRAIKGGVLNQGFYTQHDITLIKAVYGEYIKQFPTPAEEQSGWVYDGPQIPVPGPVPAPLPACARTNCPDAFYDAIINPPPPPPPDGGIDWAQVLLWGGAALVLGFAILQTGSGKKLF